MKKWQISLIFLCILSGVFIGCGKKELPKPSLVSDAFIWQNVNAVPVDSCLFISGEVGGSAENLGLILLEVQGIDDDCLGCPFVPEMAEKTYADDVMLMNSNTFQMKYCPLVKSDTYRWRLVGINKIYGMTDLPTPVMTLEMKEEVYEETEIILTNIN